MNTRQNKQEYCYGVIGKVITDKDGNKTRDEVVEQFRIHIETGVKEILHETLEWKEFKKKEKINEYEEKVDKDKEKLEK